MNLLFHLSSFFSFSYHPLMFLLCFIGKRKGMFFVSKENGMTCWGGVM